MAGSSSSCLLTNTDGNKKSLTSRSLTGIGNLIKLLPTGTVFLFQFLNPILTNNGKCHIVNKYLSGALITVCGLSCFFSCFTDSYRDGKGGLHYGFATLKGLWPSGSSDDSSCVDVSKYKIRVGDFVHAFFSLTVFAALALLDSNSVECFYPSFETTQKLLITVVPPIVSAISGAVFMVFPNTRHGIGYPSSS